MLPFLRLTSLMWATILACALVLAGVVHTLATQEVSADGGRYRAMTKSLLATGGFRAEFMPMVAAQPGEVENGHTHYFSPLWPIAMAPFYLAFGEIGFDIAFLVALGFALACVALVSRNLYGEEVALLATSAAGFVLFRVAGQRASEPLAFGLFVLMLWGILRSIRPNEQHWILLAGAMAGLAYLTRASVGWLFVVGGAAGAFWRLWFHGGRALHSHYLTAIGLFAAAWGLWAARNLLHFWDGSLAGLPHALSADAVFEWKFQRALEEPARLAYMVPAKFLLGTTFLLPFLAARRKSVLWQMRGLHLEDRSGLLLTWLVPLFMGSVIAAVFTIADFAPASPVLSLDNLRYFVFAIPGAVWGPWRPPTEPTAAAAPPSAPAPD